MTEKMKFETPDLTESNIEKLEELFPNCITEKRDENGKIIKAVNYEIFKQMFSKEIVEPGEDAYEFTWVGKKESILEANKPIRKTLRPCKEESKDWDNTENLYIEGDNLEVLKTLQESYLNSIKMIYIDPPYNTGNDFIYNDDFKMSNEEYIEETGQVDEEGNRLFKNTDTNGRFHSDWCSMMYPRLVLARNLLSEDGVIFISIDDNEQDNLKKICDEIFGENNFIANLVWANKEGGGSSDSNFFRIKHEYILCYSRDINRALIKGLPVEDIDRYKLSDKHLETRGKYQLIKLDSASLGYIESLDYPIMGPDGEEIYPNKDERKVSRWRWSKNKLKWGIKNDFVVIKKDKNDEFAVYTKQYLNCDNEGRIIERTIKPTGIISKYSTTQSNKTMKKLMRGAIFQYSKPYELIKFLMKISTSKTDMVLDFFSGSATTAHAAMELNAEDGGNRKFIMVQLPEETVEKSEAYKAGYKNICEIGKERIRRAGEKIKEDNKDKEGIENLDTGFRVLKLDDTNMKDVYYRSEDYDQNLLDKLESNIKDDRDDLDLLFGCLLDWGLPLDRPYESIDINGNKIHIYNNGDLVACFDDEILEETVKEIAKMEALRVVFRDSSFTNDPKRINVEEIFKLLSPDTSIRVI